MTKREKAEIVATTLMFVAYAGLFFAIGFFTGGVFFGRDY